MCTSEIKVKQSDDLLKDIQNLVLSIKLMGAHSGFMNGASPGVISLFLQNNYYSNRQHYLQAFAGVMKQEYKEVINSGLKLQIDCPD